MFDHVRVFDCVRCLNQMCSETVFGVIVFVCSYVPQEGVFGGHLRGLGFRV